MGNSSTSILVIAGPTASGKSDYAQSLALQLKGEIINADSQQFYQGLDIGTGKVLAREQKVPHHLLDILRPGDRMTAMDFARQADRLIQEIKAKKKVPIVVGGTGFYLRALLEGLDPLPARHDALRAELEKRLQSEGPEALYEELQKADPQSAQKIALQDRSRLVRYLELFYLSGKKPSELFQNKRLEKLRYPTETHWLAPPRAFLRSRIALRVRLMLESGWLKEVEGLVKKGLPPQQWPIKPIGYREIQDYLEGRFSLEECEKLIIKKTRAYAKRQETFFRGLFDLPAYAKAGSRLKVFKNLSFFNGLLT